jgi:transcriptional regulator PpsR
MGPDMNSRVNVAQPDIILALDLDGVIRGATLAGTMPDDLGLGAWLGRPWADTVEDVAGGRVERMLEDARTSGVSAFRQFTQRFPGGRELPMEYTAVRLGGKAGLIAIGKNLQAVAELQARLVAAQQAREQDYWKLREIETRSRLLFDASSEAVVVLRSDTGKVVEANPAAIRALGVAPGWDVISELAPRDRDAFRAMIGRAREQGRAPGILIHLGRTEAPWTARASLMTAEPGPLLLVQLAPVADLQTAAADRRRVAVAAPPAVDALLDTLPDAFVMLDSRGVVRRANRAFLDLAQAATEAAVLGERLGRWISRPGADAAILLEMLHQHRLARLFETTVTGDLGAETEVEISAAVVGEGEGRLVGLMIRDISRRLPRNGLDGQGMLSAAVQHLTQQVGRTPLVTLVRETTAVLERHCLLAALSLAGGKRTLAAELLGLSRQSLYAKLDRYGIDLADAAAAPEENSG